MHPFDPYQFQQVTTAQNRFPTASLIRLSLAEFLERFAFYGVRTILTIYMVDVLQLDRSDAVYLYGLLLIISSLAVIPAGIIGDLFVSPIICMLIGLSLSAAGCFLFLSPGKIGLISGIIMISLGSGFFKPNMLSRISAVFNDKKRFLDGSYSVMYMMINLGVLLANLVFSLITSKPESINYKLAFVLAGILFLLALLVIFFENKSLIDNEFIRPSENKTLSASAILAILATLFFAPVFWMIFQFLSDQLFYCNGSAEPQSLVHSILISLLLTGLVFAIIWFFTRIDSLYKIGLGFLILTIVLAINLFVSPCIQQTSYVLLVSEALIAIPVYSVIARLAPRKFQGLFFGIIIGSFYFVNRFLPNLEQLSDEFGQKKVIAFLLAISLIGSLLFIILGILLPKKERI